MAHLELLYAHLWEIVRGDTDPRRAWALFMLASLMLAVWAHLITRMSR